MPLSQPIPWDDVKRVTLWDYEQLHAKLATTAAFPLVRQYYILPLDRSAALAQAFFAEAPFLKGTYPSDVLNGIDQLHQAGLRDWQEYIQATNTRAKLQSFLTDSPLTFDLCLALFHYLLRFGLPFVTPIRQILDDANPTEMAWYLPLKQHGINTTFHILQQAATEQQRLALANSLGLPQPAIAQLTHRADISRLPFVRRKTVLALCHAGIDTLTKLAQTEPTLAEQTMRAYHGQKWDALKRVIPMVTFSAWARAIPPVLEG